MVDDTGVSTFLMSRPQLLENWHIEAIQLMVRSGCSLSQAATELQVPLSIEVARNILGRVSFQQALWAERHRYFSALGADPNFKKDTAIGKLLDLARKLEESAEFDKAAEVVFKVAKMTGWVGPESTINVFGELTDKDLQAIKQTVENKNKPSLKAN